MTGVVAPLMVAWQACGRDEGEGRRGAGGAAYGGGLQGGGGAHGGGPWGRCLRSSQNSLFRDWILCVREGRRKEKGRRKGKERKKI
jgi:hypothetical protein